MPDAANSGQELDAHVEVFSQAIDDCLELYRSSGEAWQHSLKAHPAAAEAEPPQALMQDLARGLLVKLFLTMVQADRRFTTPERRLAQVLLEKLWGREFELDEVGVVLFELVPLADKFDWYDLVRPFAQVPVLAERISEVETIAMRLGNLVAKIDGHIAPEETLHLKDLLDSISRHLRGISLDGEDSSGVPRCEDIRRKLNSTPGMAVAKVAPPGAVKAVDVEQPSADERLKTAMAALDELIGMDSIKNEIRELTRFLRVQKQREQAGLPRTQVSLHTVFAGNPGTGKTSVARILGDVFGALGIVGQGHLIEADRSALVAGYMGQTAERTNKIVDRALDGVLFIDEAYSLVSNEGEDPYGHEAVQVLLKRMEDHRDRLVVVLAGYPNEMERLLASNPGLASRFQRTFDFPDYSVVELCRIFGTLCEKNHYVLPAETRVRLILAFKYLLADRDEHFGNGRLVRNIFEQSIRRLANRIADVVPLTKELLTRLEPADIQLADVPGSVFEDSAVAQLQVRVACPGCGQTSRLKGSSLGRRVQCRKCHERFTAEWGEPLGA